MEGGEITNTVLKKKSFETQEMKVVNLHPQEVELRLKTGITGNGLQANGWHFV